MKADKNRTSKIYRSDLDGCIHEAANDLHKLGLISQKTMRQFDKNCLTQVDPLSPEEITDLRHHAGVSQAVFASYLNVSTGIISKWERGEKRPAGPALKLLNLAREKGLESIA